MDNAPQVTRAHMEDTRAALSEKLETLEQRMVDTVQGAADAVTQTVENVKESFDLALQVDRHPWAMLGGSLALGFVGGYLLYRHGAAQPALNGHGPAAAGTPQASAAQNGNGHPADPFAGEIAKLKRLAIGTLLSVARDMIIQSSPQPMHAGLTEVIDGITVQLGGEPVLIPVLKAGETASCC